MSPNHLPLRIEWELANPWCPPTYGLHLDGLLGHVIVARAGAGAGADLPNEETTYQDLLQDLPLARHSGLNGWCWKASMLVPTVVGSERRYLTSKTPSVAIADWTAAGTLSAKGGAKVDTVRGLYKSAAIHYPLEHVERVQAWCVGDPGEISDLLSDVYFLAGKRRLGHGRIKESGESGARFTLIEDPTALERWRHRNMPDPVDGYEMAHQPLRTPYWDRPSAAMIWRPPV